MLDLDLSLHRPSHHHRTAWSCADSMVDVVDQATSACDADDFREEAHQRRVSPECSLHAPAEDAAIAASLVSTAAFEPNATHVTGSRRVQPQDIQSSYSHSIAGAAAGFVATVTLHPLDLVKTRLHVQESNGKRLPYYQNLLHAFRSIVEVEGFLGLYQGVLPNIVGGTTAWALYMYMYNASKTWLVQNYPGLSSSAVYLTAATAAGAASTVVVHPIFIIKTRLQLQLSIKEQSVPLSSTLIPVEKRNNYTGTLAAVRVMVQEEGITSLYRGFGPSLLLVSHGSIQFLAYEHMKRGLAALQPLDPHQKSPQKLLISDLTLAATASKVVATMFTYPYQVVRSCMQQRRAVGGDMVHFETFSKTTAHLWRSEGLRAFYRGLFPHLLRSTPQSSITLLAYEYIHRGLHIFH